MLDEVIFQSSVRELAFRDEDLARVIADEAARKFLIALKGIGAWTADIYLLSALRRPDIWPVSDLALAIAVQEVKGLRSRPAPERLRKTQPPVASASSHGRAPFPACLPFKTWPKQRYHQFVALL
jgi:hypothetical protein